MSCAQHHIGRLNCGRWDYIFSFIKKFRREPWSVLPDRGQVTMTAHFLRCYSQLVVKTCHRRGVHAMGGMAARSRSRTMRRPTRPPWERVRADKKREAATATTEPGWRIPAWWPSPEPSSTPS